MIPLHQRDFRLDSTFQKTISFYKSEKYIAAVACQDLLRKTSGKLMKFHRLEVPIVIIEQVKQFDKIRSRSLETQRLRFYLCICKIA